MNLSVDAILSEVRETAEQTCQTRIKRSKQQGTTDDPGYAGLIPSQQERPETRGGSPHKRAIGHTFECEFDLPVPINMAYDVSSKTARKG